MLTSGRLAYCLVLQHPGETMRDEDGVEPGAECGVDIRARAVADHPCACSFASVVSREGKIGFIVLLRQNFDCSKVGRKTRTLKLSVLLGRITLSHEDKPMPG